MDDHKKEFVNFKLGFLERTASCLHQTVDDYISEMMTAGKSWVDDPGKVCSFQDISLLLENSIMFVEKKCKGIADGPNQEISAANSSSASTAILSGKDEAGQPLSSSLHTSADSVSVPQVADDATVRKILTHVEVLEEAVASFRSTSQAVSTNQSLVQSQVEAFDAKQLEFEEKMDGMKEKQAELEVQQNLRVSDIEKKVKKIKTRQTETGKQQDKRVNEIEKQLKMITSKQTEMEKEITEIFEEMETERSLSKEEINNLKSQLDDVGQNLNSLDKKSQDMSTKIETNYTSIHEQMAKRKKDLKRMKRMEDKLKTVEAKGREETVKLGKKYEEVNLNFQMVCSIIANRLQPLERLRDIFNRCKKRVEDRETVMGKYNEVLSKLEELSKRTEQNMEKINLKQPVGFCARTEFQAIPEIYQDISFTNIVLNEGNHFDPNTSKFTAPLDGLYLAIVNIEQIGDGKITLAVAHVRELLLKELVHMTKTVAHKTSNCCVAILKIKKGDQLYVLPYYVVGNVHLSELSTFSCCLVG